MANTYTKLKDGSWGVRINAGATVKSGQSVMVIKKDGSSKVETIKTVLWTGDGVSLCSIAQTAKNGSQAARPGTCVSCGESCNPKYKRCLDCVDGGSRARGGMSYYDRNGNFVLGDDD